MILTPPSRSILGPSSWRARSSAAISTQRSRAKAGMVRRLRATASAILIRMGESDPGADAAEAPTRPRGGCVTACAQRRQDIALADASAGAGAAEALQLDPGIAGQTAGERRSGYARAGCGRSRCRRGGRRRCRLLCFRDGRRRRLRRRSTRRRLCAAGRQAPQRRADGKLRPLRRQDRFQRAVRRRLDLDRSLVGLELDQRLALAHALAGLFQPAQHLGRFHRRAELGNQKVHREASLKHDPFKQNSSLPSFPRKRESRATSEPSALDSRFRGNDEKGRGQYHLIEDLSTAAT